MSEARALTSGVSNAVSVIVVAIWEGECDRDVLKAELDRGFSLAALEQPDIVEQQEDAILAEAPRH